MNPLQNIQTIYFVGIGGIGMSALARFAIRKELAVFGYDKTKTTLTKTLENEGADISFEDSISTLPEAVKNKETTLVVYTPAIPKNSELFQWFNKKNYRVIKRSQFLGELTQDTLCLAVAGTHGKTTTSAILGHLMAHCNMPVTAFLGGITENYKSNFISKGTEITVVEADEFDRSFLTLSPDIACITSMDADHLDVYGNAKAIEESFVEFANLVPNKKHLLFKKGLPLKGQSVAIEESAQFEAQNVRIENGAYVFDFKTPDFTLRSLEFSLPGHHNLHNAITALGMAILAGTPVHCLPEALSTFKGVERRFTYKIRRHDLVLIDDYAHHPTELDALYQAVSEMYPDDEKLIVFQPHLFSRTQDFITGFTESLAQFDQVLLLDIYPARETPIEGVNSQWLLDKIKSIAIDVDKVALISKETLLRNIQTSSCRIKLLVGAGDIGAEVSAISKALEYEN
ncbi:MAG: UDP-N-acetylmuramate--alanine ligase [Patiriisocius sp.]|jgi:UDP-N-acetylmuramate--alanine ligase